MPLIDPLPKPLEEKLATAIRSKEVAAAVSTDLDPSGRFGEEWLVAARGPEARRDQDGQCRGTRRRRRAARNRGRRDYRSPAVLECATAQVRAYRKVHQRRHALRDGSGEGPTGRKGRRRQND